MLELGLKGEGAPLKSEKAERVVFSHFVLKRVGGAPILAFEKVR